MVDWSNLDYTSMWDGIYAPPDSGALGSLYILDSERTVGRNTPIYDDCTRVLFDEAHPRTYPAGQRYPGPYGAGRATDRIGPDLADRRRTEIEHERAAMAAFRNSYYDALDASPIGGPPPSPSALRSMHWYGGGGESRPETFAGGPGGDPSAASRRWYARGNRALGHPGPRGMVTSYRGGRPAIDGIDFDNRPYHYNPEAPNEYAHLYVDPAARGPPLFSEVPSSYLGPNPQIPQVDHFVPFAGLGAAAGKTAAGGAVGAAPLPGSPGEDPPWATDPLYLYKVAFVFIAVILLATWVMVSQSERRLDKKIDALAARPPSSAARPGEPAA